MPFSGGVFLVELLAFGTMDDVWRPKKRIEMQRRPPVPPRRMSRTAKAKRPLDLDDEGDWFMEKVTSTVDPIPRPLTSILKFDALVSASPATALTSPSSDPLTALADAEVASLTPDSVGTP